MVLNRLIQTNDPLQQTSDSRSKLGQTNKMSTASVKLRKLIGNKPGTLLVIGMVAGGILAWLTSRRRQ